MANKRLTIGELAKRAGISVKTLRFYSDEGLLPPSDRTQRGYRLYRDEAVVRLDLIRTLRDAGLGLDSIKKVLSRETSLADALKLRLGAVEAHLTSLQQVAAALRAALRGTPNEDDVRRLCAVTKLSNEQRKNLIQEFYDRVSEGIPIDDEWKKKMVAVSAPDLPDNPTAEQLDAWVQLSELVADPTFAANLRENAKEVWGKFDMNKMREASDACLAATKVAIAEGESPESAPAKTIVDTYGRALADARGGTFDDKMRQGMRERFAKQDPRATRYWELVAIMRGTESPAGTVAEWKWIQTAVLHHFAG